MKIVTLEEMQTMKDGTLYAEFTPDVYESEVRLITGHFDEGGWNGAISLTGEPESFTNDSGDVDFMEWDDSDNDFQCEHEKKFVIFDDNEIDKMIAILKCAKGDISVDDLRNILGSE